MKHSQHPRLFTWRFMFNIMGPSASLHCTTSLAARPPCSHEWTRGALPLTAPDCSPDPTPIPPAPIHIADSQKEADAFLKGVSSVDEVQSECLA